MRLPSRPRRRGNWLVLFALLAPALLGLAALAIDLGLVLLAQRQMQTAADAAAVEGLRFRDAPPPGSSAATPDEREEARRGAAGTIASWAFDDDLGASAPDRLRAAAVVEFASSSAERPLAQHIREVRRYAPVLQPNLQDLPHGDMVAGSFQTVFEPGGDRDAFLVRLRRTKRLDGTPRDASDEEPGVSSTDVALPLWFGRAALIREPEAGYSPRRDGIAVRATAVAAARRALSVGVADSTNNLQGVTPFALRLSFWRTLASATLTPDGNDLRDEGGNTRGVLLTPTVLVIGDRPSLVSFEDYAEARDRGNYVPILADDDSPLAGMVVGFGFATVAPDGSSGVQITREPGRVAARNASATLVKPLAGPAVAVVAALLAANQDPAFPDPLLAPALAR